MTKATIAEFTSRNGCRVAIDIETVEALIELEAGGCQIVTGHDTHVVQASYDEVRPHIWPEVDSTLHVASAMVRR